MPKKRRIGKMKKTDFPPQNQDSTILDKSPWDSTAIFIFFCHFSVRSLLKQCIIFEILLQFSVALPYTKLKLRKNSGYTRPTLFVGWGEGLDLCELENAPETQTCPKTFVYDCRRQYEFIASLSICIILNLLNS